MFEIIQKCVKEQNDFLVAFGQTPVDAEDQNLKEILYLKLIAEERQEFADAFQNLDVIEMFDAIIDIAYVAAGYVNVSGATLTPEDFEIYPERNAYLAGYLAPNKNETFTGLALAVRCLSLAYHICQYYKLPFEAGWAEVHGSNMAKLQPDGTVLRREDGKVIKPDGWLPPDLGRVIADDRSRKA